jgi:protein involved in polysaccharide export with SLBB domain
MKNILFTAIFILSSSIYSQDLGGISSMDQDFLDSLPDTVRDDVLSEMEDQKSNKDKNLQRRPSSAISKLDVAKRWEKFNKEQLLSNNSERYGLSIFNSMQSSFMPLNEPNFGANYVIDYGDFINIDLFGTKVSSNTVEVKRDGTILIDEIGPISVAGLNFEQVTDLINKTYSKGFIGVDASVTLSKIRDINILVTGNISFPGIYTLSGNSNILQALNIAGGIKENGSIRNIILKRANEDDQVIDLYEALLFGDIENIPFLRSGDSINIAAAGNLVRAGYGFNNTAVFELKDNETISDLVRYAGGINKEVRKKDFSLVRLEDNKFASYVLDSDEFQSIKLQNLDSVYADEAVIRTVTISGNVKYPGTYSITPSDRLLDIINRSGGYTETAYPFGGSLVRSSAIDLENAFIKKSYQNLISYIATSPNGLPSGQGDGLAYILSELKSYKPSGRIIVELNEVKLEDNIDNNIYLNNGDKIHIPSYSPNIFVLGEVGNPGSVSFQDGISILEYVNKSGGLTRYSSSDSIFIVSPNGETSKVHIKGIKKLISQNYDIYPGSVIYVPRHVAKIEGINYYATIAPLFSSLALSIASLNSIKN